MKDKSQILKIATGILGVAVIVFVILLVNSHKQIGEQIQTATGLSNQVQQAAVELADHKQTITNLETELTARKADILTLSNTLAMTQTNLDQAQTSLNTAQDSLKTVQDELARRDDALAKLELQNQMLETHADELKTVIAGLTSKVEDITQKLTAAEGDKTALTAELSRVTTERAELERQFNDLNSLKAQVKKIRTDLAVAKRLDWQRAGIQTTEPKGAEKMTGTVAPPAAAASAPVAKKSNYDLNVEVSTAGNAKIVAEPKITEKITSTAATAPVAAPVAAKKSKDDLNVEVNADGTVKVIPPLNLGK